MSILCCFFTLLLAIGNLLATISNSDLFERKTIVVLGGTGYLGRAIVSGLLPHNPHRIIVFSRDEVKHFTCSKIFGNNSRIEYIIGDIRDYDRLLQVTRGADIVFHVAALKRMNDLELNVQECIKTNVMGNMNVFRACIENNVDKMLFISTDKACSPINIYGASKFVSEKIFTNYDKSKIKTRFIVARFGNILESTGSIIPFFVEKIKKGENIPLTDDRMTRFIIDKNGAVALLFDALRYGTGGEIFTKSLPAMKITDLIEILQNHYGSKTTISVIGIRPGEKLHEMMFNRDESLRVFDYQNYYIIRSSVDHFYDDRDVQPNYVAYGKRITHGHKLTSDQTVVSQEELLELLKQLQVLE